MTKLAAAGTKSRAGSRPGPRRLRRARFWADASGATSIEYAIICGLVFLVAASGMTLFGDQMTAMFGTISSRVTSVP